MNEVDVTSLLTQSILAAGTKAKQGYNDAEAKVLKAALCAQSVGAFYRVNTEAERGAIETLCNPDGAPGE